MAQRRIDFLSLMYKKSSDPGNSPTASRRSRRADSGRPTALSMAMRAPARGRPPHDSGRPARRPWRRASAVALHQSRQPRRIGRRDCSRRGAAAPLCRRPRRCRCKAAARPRRVAVAAPPQIQHSRDRCRIGHLDRDRGGPRALVSPDGRAVQPFQTSIAATVIATGPVR